MLNLTAKAGDRARKQTPFFRENQLHVSDYGFRNILAFLTFTLLTLPFQTPWKRYGDSDIIFAPPEAIHAVQKMVFPSIGD
jgi:hypothetical protein